MSKTVWIVNLPDKSEKSVKSGQKISAGDILAEKGDTKIKAPVQSVVKEIKKNKIQLEFESEKISGQGLNEKNNWGEIKWQPEIDYSQLSIDYQGKIIILKTKNLTSFFVSKARTLGVKGLVGYSEQPNLENSPIPILIVDESEAKLIKKKEGVKCLLDTSSNCLLIPKNE